MKIDTLSLGALSTNCYLVYDEKNKEGIIIDPSDEAQFIAEKVVSLKFAPQAIIATHGHFDHLLAAGELQLILNIPFFIHRADLFLLKDANKSAKYWLKHHQDTVLPENINYLKNKDKIKFGQYALEVIETPGHTPGSISLFSPPLLFSGDTLFKGAIGRYDFSYSNYQNLINSLHNLFFLPDSTIVYPGHAEPTTIKEEKNIN